MKMSNTRFFKNPFYLFLPVLIIQTLFVLYINTDGTTNDEGRYLSFAQNLLNGFYSTPYPDVNLGNGPGYPLFILPIVFLNLPLVTIALLNVLMYYFSIVIVFKVIRNQSGQKIALFASIFWAFYLNSYEKLPYATYETLVMFLIILITYCLNKAFSTEIQSKKRMYFLISGILLGYLSLTHPIFGYVNLTMLFGILLVYMKNRANKNIKFVLYTILISFLIISPYLIYTYNLSGKLFYMSTNGGDNLYWMSTPYKSEYGDWYRFKKFKDDFRISRDGNGDDSIKQNHLSVYKRIEHLNLMQKDDTLKKIAIQNIEAYPFKFLQNCFSNMGRIIFNTPYSYTFQTPKTLLRLPYNGILLVLLIFSFIPAFLNWRQIAFSLRFMIFFSFIYFGGSILGSAETRMFTYIVPVLLIWVSYIFSRSLIIKWKFD
jgi:4-amino-4-deoxy-L-arabinose transferase-like glycosyltransferase